MPGILAIETATKVCSIALMDGDEILGETSLNIPQVHVERLVVMINDMLGNLHLSYGDLDAVAVSNGPGSFTGLRIGLSVAKGIAFAEDKKLIAVPTLDAIAYGLRGFDAGKTIVPILHARAEEFYYASFKFKGEELALINDYRAAEAEDIAGEFSVGEGNASGAESDTVFVGEGVLEFSKHVRMNPLSKNVKRKFGEDSMKYMPASARQVAFLAGAKFGRSDFADVKYLVPLYIKDFVAVKGNPLNKLLRVKSRVEKN
ncbi:MAG: tRNA (adenosine(37)-N6)-threonylcarbamoyltransferase complex dimerization subunit type 1 TsaB [Candidatus Kryptoniota bacterium]